MKFGFYRKNDPEKEIIMTKTAEDMHQAVQFLEIFAVKNIKRLG